MQFSIGVIVILFLEAAFQFIGAVDVKRVMCETPVLSTVAVDEPYHRFFPYFVRLHRCQGSCGHKSPNIKLCVATEYKNIKITVHDSTNGWQQKEITVQNHTSCGHQCKASASDCDLQVQEWNEQSCECKCLYSHSPPPKEVIKPRKGFRWNNYLCRYECNRPREFCSLKKRWSDKECSCVCQPFYEVLCKDDNKYMDPETCACKNPMEIASQKTSFITYAEFQILAAFLCFAIVVIIVLSFCLFRLHHKLGSHRFDCSATTSEAESDGPGQDNPAAKYETPV